MGLLSAVEPVVVEVKVPVERQAVEESAWQQQQRRSVSYVEVAVAAVVERVALLICVDC